MASEGGNKKRSVENGKRLEQAKRKKINLCVFPKKEGYETIAMETPGHESYFVFVPLAFKAIKLNNKWLLDKFLSKYSVELRSHTDYEYFGTEWADVHLGCTALSYAASIGKFNICQHLIQKHDADIHNGINIDGDNTLHYAVMSGDVDMVLYLLRRGAEKSNGFSVYSSATKFQYNDNEHKIKALLKWYLGPQFMDDECENDTDPLVNNMLTVLPKPGTEDFRLYMDNEGVLTEEKVGRAIAALFSAQTWKLPFGRTLPLTIEAPRFNSRWKNAMHNVLSQYLPTHDCFRHLRLSAVCKHAVDTKLLHVMVSTPAYAYIFHPLFRQVDIGRFHKAQKKTTIMLEKDLLKGCKGLVVSMSTPYSITLSETDSYTSSIVRHVTGKRLLLTPKSCTDDLFNVHKDCMNLLKTTLTGCHNKMLSDEAMANNDEADCIHTATVFKVEV